MFSKPLPLLLLLLLPLLLLLSQLVLGLPLRCCVVNIVAPSTLAILPCLDGVLLLQTRPVHALRFFASGGLPERQVEVAQPEPQPLELLLSKIEASHVHVSHAQTEASHIHVSHVTAPGGRVQEASQQPRVHEDTELQGHLQGPRCSHLLERGCA